LLVRGFPDWSALYVRQRRVTFFQRIILLLLLKKVKWFRYRPGLAVRVGRGIALLFHDRGTRREWVVSTTSRPHFTPGKDPVPILQEAGWAPGSVWTGGKSRPHRDSIPGRPARSQSLYQLSHPAHIIIIIIIIIISFMQGICTYIPDTNYVPREYSVAAILLLLFMVLMSLVPVLNLLYFYISTLLLLLLSIQRTVHRDLFL